MTQWHIFSAETAVSTLNSHAQHGLSSDEAQQRLVQQGPNSLVEQGRKHPLRLFWEQIASTLVIMLIAAGLISGLLGKQTEMIAILAIVLLFAVLGFLQEYRAEQAMAALKKMAVPFVPTLRGGQTSLIPSADLVPGDVITLEEGQLVPADVRLLVCSQFKVQEAALTGEAESVDKTTDALSQADVPLGNRRNMAYMGTAVTYGRATALVVATGMETELGKIATLIQSVQSEATPLQQRLDQIGKLLAAVGVVVAALVMGIGLLQGESLSQMFLTAVSVAVAVIPEGLPAVVTATLALGAQRMLQRQALIRKLPAVETLGSVNIICSDKTGTLTENRMTVTVIDVAGQYLELSPTQNHPAPALEPSSRFQNQPASVGLTLVGGALCNNASLKPDPQSGRFLPIGDPTEGALLVVAQEAGLLLDDLKTALPRVAEWPFDASRKRMTTVHKLPDALPLLLRDLGAPPQPYVAFTKGAADGLLSITTAVLVNNQIEPLTPSWQERIQAANDQMAANGIRVLGVALRWLAAPPTLPDPTLESELIFVGLVGIIDPPRGEVKTAVQACLAAGIRPIMITGDHPLTARFIATDLGIVTSNNRVVTGQQIDQMDAATLAAVVAEASIYARVSPEHKLQIVEALQRQGNVVSMTGDGVNDAPALKKANIGVAMGITGTDVSKEAADMVLLDDNFTTIVTAVREGRLIYDNIIRFVRFSVAGNLGKVLIMLLAPLLGSTIALQPLQLLWLNLLTDGLLGLGLGLEPAEANVMRRPPRQLNSSVWKEELGWQTVQTGLVVGLLALGILIFHSDLDTWQTMLFTALAFLQVGQAWAARATLRLRDNPTVVWLTLLVVGLQLLVLYLPGLRAFFAVVPLSLGELGITAVLGLVAFGLLQSIAKRSQARGC